MCVVFIISGIYYDFIKVLLLLGLKRLKFCYVYIYCLFIVFENKKKKIIKKNENFVVKYEIWNLSW